MRLAIGSFPQNVDPVSVLPAGSSQSEKRNLRKDQNHGG
jgi:hypothetical protein